MTFVLDAYAARSCPLKTVHSFTPHLVAPSLERPDPPFFHDADAIEAQVCAAVAAGGGRIVDLRPLRAGPSASAEAACLAALDAGADVIIGGSLPRDEREHRTGRPSLLIRADEGGYHPVQIKYHRVLESSGRDQPATLVSRLDAPRDRFAWPERRFRWNTRLNAALQVAHYWRLLQACEHAAAHPWAGLIGLDQLNLADPGSPARLEQVITWLDLDIACVPPNPRDVEHPGDADPITALDRYDAEHRYRVTLARAALASSGQDVLLTPIRSSECSGCVWQEHCQDQLDADDLSLRITKAPLDIHEVRTLRRLGISTVTELAQADLDALLVDYLPRASHRASSEARLRRAHHRAQLMSAGIPLERQTGGPLDVPRHALEIDVDIETSADDRVYLWGFWVDDGERRYGRQFARFTDLDDTEEAALAAEALSWLRTLVADTDAAVYHYSEYEVVRLHRLESRLGDIGAWASAWAADHFVDLFQIMRTHFFGAYGLGLKVVTAAVTGFTWRDEDPGGLNSQRWFAEAVGDPDDHVRELARIRVLEYNEDDVRATWHLRQWLRQQA